MQNSIKVFQSYLWKGKWVFDASTVYLVREPFISGADIVIDLMVAYSPCDQAKMRGWLCPARDNYFLVAPKKLYVEVC